ncbi:F-box protein, partial [Mucuna pruriens]
MSSEKNSASKLEKQEDCKVFCLLDLPEWTLDCILECLSPLDLCRVAQVSTCLRDRTRSDALWEKHIKQKWGRLLGDVAHQEWQWHTTKINTQSLLLLQHGQSGSCGSFSGVWPFLSFHSYLDNFIDFISLFKNCSKMTLYICLETGRFWFPVQVFKNANQNQFCYDAIVSYDSKSDTFQARSPTGGWRMIEGNTEWDRLRLSPVETSPRAFYMSNCMNDLKPGDQIEIQMRRRKDSPYDWWYAVIGHLETCDEDVNHCHCQCSDMLVVEFKQYRPESRWRRALLNRKNMYEEQGTRLRWFGGIRKLDKEEEIQRSVVCSNWSFENTRGCESGKVFVFVTDELVVEFKQYVPESKWRRASLNRNVYKEQRVTESHWFAISSRFQQTTMSSEKNWVPKLKKQEDCEASSCLLDLPEWTLDCILECLSPLDLCRVAQVSTCLRDRSRSDALWDKQIKQKWGRLLGDVALQEWQLHTTKITNTKSFLLQHNQSGSCGSFSGVWPFLSFHSYLDNFIDFISLFKNCSKMALYICLETGRFWFPVQVYKNAKLYYYNAIVSYDSRTDTFRARSPIGGWPMIQGNIQWDRLRLTPAETFPRVFYLSNNMNDLKPGDQIEIQMRRRKESPYDWWYAAVGHLETCDEDVNHCRCQYSDMLVVEFKQYRPQGRRRRTVLKRNVYEEQGTRLRWFGGIRKLEKEEEIQRWNNLFASR